MWSTWLCSSRYSISTVLDTYVTVLFVDFSSAFNIIVKELLQFKLSLLSVPDPSCWWVMDFLTNRRQQVWLERLRPGVQVRPTRLYSFSLKLFVFLWDWNEGRCFEACGNRTKFQ